MKKKIMVAAVVILFVVAIVFATKAIATVHSERIVVKGSVEDLRNYLEEIERDSSESISMPDMARMINGRPPTVIIVGGWNPRDEKLMKAFLESIPGLIGIVPNRMLPLKTAARELMRQIRKDKKIKGKLVIIAVSFAGLVARVLAVENPGVVTAIVTIGTGLSFGSMPEVIREAIFGTGDENSTIPLYVIAGYNDSPARFYMDDGDLNDGLVSLKTVLGLGKRKVLGKKVFRRLGHFDLFQSQDVIRATRDLIEKYRNPFGMKPENLIVR